MRAGLTLLALSGCADSVWDQRQVRCEELESIRYLGRGPWPLRLGSSTTIDEDCEVKTAGIRDAFVELDDGMLSLEDVHQVELEIDPSVFPTPQDYPLLDIQWPQALFGQDEGISRITGDSHNQLDFLYGPAVDRVHIGSIGQGALGYGREATGYSGNGDAPFRAELRVGCEDCYVNIRANGVVQVEVNYLTQDLPCQQNAAEPDTGLCTGIRGLGPIPEVLSHEICIGASSPGVYFRGGPTDNVKIVVLGEGVDSVLQRIDVETGGTVLVVTPDLDFSLEASAGLIVDGLDLNTVPFGPEMTVLAPQGAIVGVQDPVLREGACELGLPVLDVE